MRSGGQTDGAWRGRKFPWQGRSLTLRAGRLPASLLARLPYGAGALQEGRTAGATIGLQTRYASYVMRNLCYVLRKSPPPCPVAG